MQQTRCCTFREGKRLQYQPIAPFLTSLEGKIEMINLISLFHVNLERLLKIGAQTYGIAGFLGFVRRLVF
jgi:hypothetical protein